MARRPTAVYIAVSSETRSVKAYTEGESHDRQLFGGKPIRWMLVGLVAMMVTVGSILTSGIHETSAQYSEITAECISARNNLNRVLDNPNSTSKERVDARAMVFINCDL
jgi:hypothetical protein